MSVATTTYTKLPAQSPPRKRRFRGRIGLTLLVYFVLLTVLPLTFVGIVALNRVEQHAEDQVVRQLQSVSEIKISETQRWLDSSQSVMELIFSDQAQESVVISILTIDANWISSKEYVNRYLNAQLERQTNFYEFFIYDLDGEVYLSTNDAQVGKIIRTQPYFLPSMTEEYIQSPYFELGSADLNMVITHPLLDEDGGVVGVIAGRLNLDDLSEIMTRRTGLGQTGETYLVSLENRYLVTASRFEGFPQNHSYTSAGIRAALDGNDGSGVYTNYRHERVIGVYHWIPELKSAMLAEISEEAAMQPLRAVRNFSMLSAIIAVVVAVVVASGLTLWITRPIIALTNVTKSVMAGDYSQRVSVRRNNEIGQLADSFNTMTDQLLKMVDERNKRIREIADANQALKLATAQAQEAARLKSEFLANVSHELRTPLNAIIGFSDMLIMGMSGELNEKQNHKVLRLQENGKRLLNLINNILDLTRIESGRTEILHLPFSPQDMSKRITAQMEVLAHQKGLEFETVVDPDLPETLMGDEKHIEQVVINLLSNAFKFTESGGVTLHVKAVPQDDLWVLSVNDSGIGVPPHALDLIFDEFRQVDGSSTRAYKGTGLGLAISRNLVRMMGGKITVESTLGEGSTFTVTLPIIVPEPIEEEPEVEGMVME